MDTTRRQFFKNLRSDAFRQTLQEVTGQTLGQRIVRALVAVCVVMISYLYVKFINHSSQVFSDAAKNLMLFGAATAAVACCAFVYYWLVDGPYQLWKRAAARAEKAESEQEAAAPQLAALRARLQQAQTATEKAASDAADRLRRLQEISPYLEMLQADHKLAEFDSACPEINVPVPPQPTGDAKKDDFRWYMFAEGVRELAKAPHDQMASHGLHVLDQAALDRIEAAGKRATVAQFRPEEEGVAWPSNDLRMKWLFLAARLDQLRVERENAKKHLSTLAGEVTRGRKVEAILRLMPKELDQKTKVS
jgi:hypothetical protein